MRPSTLGYRMVSQSNFSNPLKIIPNSTNSNPRTITWRHSSSLLSPRVRRFSNENGIATPAMNKNNGKIRSYGVNPFQSV